MKPLLNIPRSVRTIAVTCLQWGDTGKGKVVDLLADWADIIVRGTGGANAGHSVCLNKTPFVFHLIPSGILRDRAGKTNVIAAGWRSIPGYYAKSWFYWNKKTCLAII